MPRRRATRTHADALTAERAAIAAYLRAEANRTIAALERADRSVFARAYGSIHRYADAIERGAHLMPTTDPTAPQE